MRAIVMTPGRKAQVVEQDWNLAALQEAVGGFIESVVCPWPDASLYVNEEGKLNGLPPNPVASAMAHQVEGFDDVLVGPAVLIGFDPGSGEEIDLPMSIVEEVTGAEPEEDLPALVQRVRAENALRAVQMGVMAAITGQKGEEACVSYLRLMADDLDSLWATTETREDIASVASTEATIIALMCALEGGPWIPPISDEQAAEIVDALKEES